MKASFETQLMEHFSNLVEKISTDDGEWTVKGFIDVYKNIYTISIDTKVISKIIELMIFPTLQQFATENGYDMKLSEAQNYYPDITFIDSNGDKYALDLKTTYRKNEETINGMTLGAFTGYFRYRNTTKNISFPYQDYFKHYVLGIIYSRVDDANKRDERKTYRLDELKTITSVAHNFQIFVQEKYKLAIGRPGSGNTKNIGSVTKIEDLINGNGPFTKLGIKIFDDYWMNYLTKDMARAAELAKPPYRNLKEYFSYKNLKIEDF